MRVSVNIGRDIENIVRSYSEIKQYFFHSATTQQLRDNHLLEFHLHNIEEKLLNIRAEASAVKAQIDAELSTQKSGSTDNLTSVSTSKPAEHTYSVPKQTQPYHPTIDVSKYRTDIFSNPSVPEQPEENKTAAANENDDFQYHLKCYKQKCAKLEGQGKLLETRLWISFSITVICIFLFIFFYSFFSHSSNRFPVQDFCVPLVMIFGPLACFLKYFLWKPWQWYKLMKNEKLELEENLKAKPYKIQESISNEDKKYIDNILKGFDSKLENIKTGFWKGLWFWLLFNIGNFLIIASTIRYSPKDSEILLPCIIWLIATTGCFLLPSLNAWLKLKHEKTALENSKIAPSCIDPEIAILSTDELAERMDIVSKKKMIFLILTVIFTVVAVITAPGLILLLSYGKQLTEPGAIIFYIIIALNYAMGIISFLCFSKYWKEYKRLQRR